MIGKTTIKKNMKNTFNSAEAGEIIERINHLDGKSEAVWGKMNVSQMLAHCNVTYELIYTDKHPKPGAFLKFMLKVMVKKLVTSEKPYKRNGQTGPMFIITDEKDFGKEKEQLIAYINKTQQLGEGHFEGKESHSFGALTAKQWNTMFYKHLDHHLRQFGA